MKSSRMGFGLLGLALILANPFASPASGARATASSGSGTTGSGMAVVRLIRADEKVDGLKTLGNGASSQTVHEGHEVELVFRYMSGGEISTSGGAATNGSGGTPINGGLESNPDSSGGGGTPPPFGYYLYVNNPYVIGQIPNDSQRSATAYPGGSFTDSNGVHTVPAGWKLGLWAGDEVPLQNLANAAGVVSGGGTMTVTLQALIPAVPPNPNIPGDQGHPPSSMWYQADYAITKQICGDASVDSRRAFGQPNLAGELPGDPNADPFPVLFGNWVFRGGLFIGNMPWTTFDESGTGRLQLYPMASAAHTNPRLVSLSMYSMGTPPNIGGSQPLSVYTPAGSDPNIASTEATVNWDTRWTSVVPHLSPGTPRCDQNDEIFKIDFGAHPIVSDFANWTLTTVTPSLATTDLGVLDRICITMDGEFDLMQQTPTPTSWRYFASKEYVDATLPFPRNDCAPRLWIIDVTRNDMWGSTP